MSMEDHRGEASSSSLVSSFRVLALLVVILSVTYGYCYFIVKGLPKGLLRLISLLGVFYILFHIPWFFPSSIFLRGLASFFLSWVSSFKLVLFSFDKGDLTNCDKYVDFVLVAAFPLKVNPEPSSSPSIKVLAISVLFFSVLFTLVDNEVVLFLLLMFVVVHLARTIRPHLEMVPILNQPHRGTSLGVFWGKRWNRVSSDILRHTIYNPTLEALDGLIGTGPKKVIALVVTLVVSGIMHEIMFYHMTCGKRPTWEVTRFFVLQGLCMTLEIAIKKVWVRTLGWPPLSPIFSVPLTIGFLLGTSYWLLVLPVLRITGSGCDS